MIAPDRQLVRRLRQQVRARLRASATLRQTRRRHRSKARHYHWTYLRCLMPVAAFFVGWQAGDKSLPAFLALWTLTVTCMRATQLQQALYAPNELWFFFQWPVSDDAVFQHQRTRVVRSAVWLALDWLALGCGLALQDDGVLPWLVAPFGALAQGTVALALAVWAVHLAPRLPYGMAPMAAWIAFIVCLQARGIAWAREGFIEPFLTFLLVGTPGAWVLAAYRDAAAGGWVGWGALVGVSAFSAFAVRWGFAALRAGFSVDRVFEHDAVATGSDTPGFVPDEPPPLDASTAPTKPLEELPPPEPRPAVDLAAVRTGLTEHLDAAPGFALFSLGWMERTIVRLLTPRQRLLVDFLRPAFLWSWSRGWMLALGVLALARVIHLTPFGGTAAAVMTAVALVFFALPTFGGGWRACDGFGYAHQRVGFQSLAPTGFGEIAVTMLTINALRTLLAAPLVLFGVRYGFTAEPMLWADALSYTWRVLALTLALQPGWVILAFSKTTNDVSARWWFTVPFVIALTVGAIGFLFAGIAFFADITFRHAWPAAGALLIYTHLLLAGYGLAYRRAIFDLITRPQPAFTA